MWLTFYFCQTALTQMAEERKLIYFFSTFLCISNFLKQKLGRKKKYNKNRDLLFNQQEGGYEILKIIWKKQDKMTKSKDQKVREPIKRFNSKDRT